MNVFLLLGTTLIVAALGLIASGARGDRSRGRRRCPRCWYDMEGTPGLTCPECGKAAKEERSLFATRYRRGRIKLGLLLTLAAGVLLYAAAMGWPQLLPAAAWRAAMPYLDPHAEEEIAASGLPSRWGGPKMGPWERLKLAYRASLVLDGRAAHPPITRGTVRQHACWALWGSRLEGRIAWPAVRRVFEDPESTPRERGTAFSALNALTYFRDRAFIGATLLSDRDVEVRRSALSLLKNPNPTHTDIIPALIGALRDRDGLIRRDAAELLGWFDAAAVAALPELDRLAAEDPDSEVRDHALGAAIRIRLGK